MFTGIVEALAEITAIEKEQSNIHFTLTCPFTSELKIDQSVAHNGCCLTVVAIEGDTYTVTAIQETLIKTNLGTWKIGDKVNVERCMPMNGRLDGHIVQGHVDTTANCTSIEQQDGSWIFSFEYNKNAAHLTVEKGSITVNGTSLTVVNSKPNTFSVAIIPYTYDHTVFHQLKTGDKVNLEFDIVGKYVARLMEVREM